MGEKIELFPSFPELCASAREIEKKPLAIPPRPIDGKLSIDANSGIFPREFEDYTYGFLLFESQKVERKIYTNAIASAPSGRADATSALTPEQQMQQELRKFVSAQEESLLDSEEQGLVKSLDIKRAKEAAQKPSWPDEGEEEGAPAPEEEIPAPEPEQEPAPAPAKARILPPKAIPKAPYLPDKKTPAARAVPPSAQTSAKYPAVPSAPQLPLRTPSQQLPSRAPTPSASQQMAAQQLPSRTSPPSLPSRAAPQILPKGQVVSLEKPPAENMETPAAEAAPKPPGGISSYSKLSPRLQAIIEAKLRREEEKARKQREDSEIFKSRPPEPQPEEETPAPEEEAQASAPEQQEAGDSMLDRTFGRRRKLPDVQDEEIPEHEPAEAEEEAPRKLPLRRAPAEEEVIAPENEEAPAPEEEAPAPEEELPAPEEEMEKPAPSMRKPIMIEKEAPEEEEKESAPAEEKEEIEMPPLRRAAPGTITIKPMFPDASPRGAPGQKEAASPSEDSDRMKRIQRILEDLSPGKARAKPQPAPGQEEVSFDRDGGEDEAQEEVAPKAMAGIKAKKQAKQKAAKAAPVPAARQKKTFAPVPAPAEEEPEPEDEKPAPQKKRLPLRAPVAEEDEAPEAQEPEEEEEKPALPQRKIPARAPPVEEEPEPEGEEEKPALPQRRIPVRMPMKEEEPAEEEQEAPVARVAPRKLIPRLPPRAEESEDDEARPVLPVRRRILPGMGRTLPSAPTTYVPPARDRKPVAIPSPAEEEAPAEQPEAEEQQEISPSVAPIKPRKLVSDEPLSSPEKTPEQLAMEEKMAKMAEQLARLEAGKVKEVAGTAALPPEEEDVPLPDDDVPKPEDYSQAKESLRRNLEQEGIARKVRQEEEATVEQYAKEHMVWLYEIYKMGGMGREDFIQKAAEKYAEAKSGAASGAPQGEAPPNPALANLGKEIEKKDKK